MQEDGRARKRARGRICSMVEGESGVGVGDRSRSDGSVGEMKVWERRKTSNGKVEGRKTIR